MKALVIGGGGREHALAWKLHRSPSITELHASPGNPGIAEVATCHSGSDYLDLAKSLGVDFAVVGPEAPLVAGVVDQFRAARIPIVGPAKDNAQLEGSKVHSKTFMERVGIPTARFQTAGSMGEAEQAIRKFDYPLVLKTDGLAAGKGVVIARSREEAETALRLLPLPLVIEEFLEGEEVSFIVLADGKSAVPLEPTQDHKTAFDGDTGPNTGGMGAYSDSRILDAAQREMIMDQIIRPVIEATGYTGFLYAGLMMTPSGPKVLEFNVRLGDPETQPLMLRLASDWGEALLAATEQRLKPDLLQWDPQPATCVVLASHGYPGEYATGYPLSGLDQVPDAVVFQAGTKRLPDGRLGTASGRVLGVTASGPSLQASIDRAYSAVHRLQFEGMFYRKDIGAKGLRRYNVERPGT